MPEFRNKTLQAYKVAFETPYLDTWNNVDRFARHIESCYRKHRGYGRDYVRLSPHIALIQSRGSGKSRLCARYGETKEPVIYISSADRAKDCYPQGNSDFRQRFEKAISNKTMFDLLSFIFVGGLNHLTSLVKEKLKKEDVMKRFMADQDIHFHQGKVFKRYHSWLDFTGYCQNNLDKAFEEFKNAMDSSGLDEDEYPVIVLVVDEAEVLSELGEDGLEMFKRCLTDLDRMVYSKNMRFFVVLSDSSLSLAKLRFVGSDEQVMMAHEPFFAVNNMNLAFMEQAAMNTGELYTEEKFFDKANYYQIGRPLWVNPIIDGGSFTQTAIQLIYSVITRFRGQPYSMKDPVSKEFSTAILNARVPLNLLDPNLIEVLSASHMRLIRSISEDGQEVCGSYGNEPILAEASRQWSMVKNYMPISLLQNLQEMIVSGSVDSRNIDELVVAYIYILARDKIAKEIESRNYDIHPVFKLSRLLNPEIVNILKVSIADSFESFKASEIDRINELANQKWILESHGKKTTAAMKAKFIPEYISDRINRLESVWDTNVKMRRKNLDSLLDGDVSFSHFLETDQAPNSQQLKEAFYRGNGFMARSSDQSGLEIFIPVRVKRETLLCLDDDSIYPDQPIDADHLLEKSNEENLSSGQMASLNILRKAYEFKISELVAGSDDFLYTAIFIQCKNSSSDDFADYPISSEQLPFIAVKHVLKNLLFSIHPMEYEGQPYRHGVVYNGLQPDLFNSKHVGAESQSFRDKVMEVLYARYDPYRNVKNSSDFLVSAGLSPYGG
jgi:hypothetical protein